MRNERIAAVGAIATLVIVAAFVLFDVGTAYRSTASQIAQNHGIPSRYRRIQGAFGLQISRDFLVEARAFVRPGETYALIVGPNFGDLQQPAMAAVSAFTTYALLPNQSALPSKADWLLCYGCDLASFSVATIAWQQQALAIARLRP